MKMYQKIIRDGLMLAGLIALALGLGAKPASADPYEGYRIPAGINGQVEQRVTSGAESNY